MSEIEIRILGTGCANCRKLEANLNEVLEELEINATVVHVSDMEEIAAYGIMSIPGLVINGKVVSAGKAIKPKKLKELLKGEL